jgi:hypothetical protein
MTSRQQQQQQQPPLVVLHCCSGRGRASGTSALVVSDAQYHQLCLVRILALVANPAYATSSSCPSPTTHFLRKAFHLIEVHLSPPASYNIGNLTHNERAFEDSRFFHIVDASRIPTTNAACARFRRARKVGTRMGLVNPIMLACQLTAIEDMLTAAKTVHSARMASIHTRIRAFIDEVEAVEVLAAEVGQKNTIIKGSTVGSQNLLIYNNS